MLRCLLRLFTYHLILEAWQSLSIQNYAAVCHIYRNNQRISCNIIKPNRLVRPLINMSVTSSVTSLWSSISFISKDHG
ncbi:uncharacterized protein GGS25DRAFT_507475 [Hypoxylon fragiforme]|uniref:uncharacterized protein n=1 Tax=Hypoxylon fragiforme TaxID=63214 RepID=UPI0020C6E2F3|nr:uncharacterized protein GGS25DRAFT_507475 [Hypoxylon fragiforme]KAI2604237.1 hypothetical protein GGS25DRAFT_507475 [Hypoxylon fragiforme]